MKLLGLLSMMCLLATTGIMKAEELPKPKMMLVRGGLLCDTEIDIQTLLSEVSLANGNKPENVPASCGSFTPRQPVPMMVTPLYWYSTPLANTLISKFHYVQTDWTQYGWIAYIPNPDFVPVVLDEAT